MFGTNGQRKSVDDRREDLQKDGNPVVTLRLVEECVESVVDRCADDGTAVCELSVDSMGGHFEIFALLGIGRIEERNEACDERVCDVVLSNRVVDLDGENEMDEDLVDERKMHPLWIGIVAFFVFARKGRL